MAELQLRRNTQISKNQYCIYVSLIAENSNANYFKIFTIDDWGINQGTENRFAIFRHFNKKITATVIFVTKNKANILNAFHYQWIDEGMKKDLRI